MSDKFDKLLEAVDKGYAMGLIPGAGHFCARTERGDLCGCALTAAFFAHNPEEFANGGFPPNLLITNLARAEYGLTQNEMCGFLNGFDGHFREWHGHHEESWAGYEAGKKAREKHILKKEVSLAEG